MSHIAPSFKTGGLSSPIATVARHRQPKGLAKLWSNARWTTRISLLAFLLVLLAAIFGPMVAPYDPNAQTLLARLRPPVGFERAMAIHPLGTDQLGRDLLSRTLYGLRLTMLIALIGSLISLVVGVFCGIIAGYVRGRTGALVMAVVDVQMAVPFTLIALLAVGAQDRPRHSLAAEVITPATIERALDEIGRLRGVPIRRRRPGRS